MNFTGTSRQFKIRRIFCLSVITFLFSFTGIAKQIANVELKDLHGNTVKTSGFIESGRPVLLVFFAICCSPSLNALDDLNEFAGDLEDEYNLKIILISIDDSRNKSKIAPLLKSKGLNIDCYLDENGDFRRVMGVSNKPHYILFDTTSNSVFEKVGYSPGIDEEIISELEKLQ